MKLLIATGNKGKFSELANGLADLPIELLSLRDVSASDFSETGTTFAANAFLKANHYHAATGLPTLADDSGLMVDRLNGEPGVRSRRWPGHEATDEELMALLLDRLSSVPEGERTARFVCALAFIFSPKHSYTTEHAVQGKILHEPVQPIKAGIPWSSLFFALEANKVYSALSDDEKLAISHRGGALRKIKPFISKHI